MTDDDSGTTADSIETRKNLNESADKIRLKTQVKRGDGTRDQDTHDIKVRGETPTEAAENLSETLAEMEDRGVFDRVRSLQPEASINE